MADYNEEVDVADVNDFANTEFEDETTIEEDVDFAEENSTLGGSLGELLEDAFEKVEDEERAITAVVTSVEDDSLPDLSEFEEIPVNPASVKKVAEVVSTPVTASVSPRANKEDSVGKTEAKASKTEKTPIANPQFIKRKSGTKFLKNEEIVNLTAEFTLDDVTITLVVKKSKTVKAFLCSESSYLDACSTDDGVTTITLEDELTFDERSALDIIRKANVKYDLQVKTCGTNGDKLNTRMLGLKVTRALNEKLKVKAASV